MTHGDREQTRPDQPTEPTTQPPADFRVGEPVPAYSPAPRTSVYHLTAEDAERMAPRIMEENEEMFRILAQ